MAEHWAVRHPGMGEGLRMVACRAAREWAAEHRHQQPDDRMVDAVLAALFDACGVMEVEFADEPGYLLLRYPPADRTAP